MRSKLFKWDPCTVGPQGSFIQLIKTIAVIQYSGVPLFQSWCPSRWWHCLKWGSEVFWWGLWQWQFAASVPQRPGIPSLQHLCTHTIQPSSRIQPGSNHDRGCNRQCTFKQRSLECRLFFWTITSKSAETPHKWHMLGQLYSPCVQPNQETRQRSLHQSKTGS